MGIRIFDVWALGELLNLGDLITHLPSFTINLILGDLTCYLGGL